MHAYVTVSDARACTRRLRYTSSCYAARNHVSLCTRARVNCTSAGRMMNRATSDSIRISVRDTETRSAKRSYAARTPDTFAAKESLQSVGASRRLASRLGVARDNNARYYRGAEITRCSFSRAQRASHLVARFFLLSPHRRARFSPNGIPIGESSRNVHRFASARCARIAVDLIRMLRL